MKAKRLYLLPVLMCLVTPSAHANWQYDGSYLGDGWYSDDGARFVISVRGGASYGVGKIKNDIGALTSEYFIVDGRVLPAIACGGDCTGYESAGYAEMGSLSPRKDFSSFSFAAGASVGFTMPNRPQWRMELGWDTISNAEYNQSPLFEGDVALIDGDVPGINVLIQSGGVQSKLSTDVISAMAFYDFFDGLQKPLNEMIPYIGFGVGYADSKTTLNLFDPYGDLSLAEDLRNFGELNSNDVVQFYRSETNTANVAGIVALGASYGISDGMYLDFGLRVMYIPRVKWALTSKDGSRQRDWFSAENLIYTNIMLGLRFEF